MTKYTMTVTVEGREYEATDTVDEIEESIANVASDSVPAKNEYSLSREFNGETVTIDVKVTEK